MDNQTKQIVTLCKSLVLRCKGSFVVKTPRDSCNYCSTKAPDHKDTCPALLAEKILKTLGESTTE